jgi:hypothetical protein
MERDMSENTIDQKMFGSEIYQAAANHYEPIIAGLKEQIDEHNLCQTLIDAWIAENGGQISWGKAVQIISIITKMDENERSRLLTLDEPDIQSELVKLRADNAALSNAKNLVGE